MKRIFILISLLVSIAVAGLLFAPVKTFAQTQASTWQAPKITVGPKDGFKFILKRFTEKVMLIVYKPFSSRREQFYQKIFDDRLSELVQVANDKDIANIETASTRYSSTAGELTEYIIAKKLSDKKQSAIEQMTNHIPVLVAAQDNFDYKSSEWRFIQDDINSLKTYINNLQN